jgi:hypothetical protein
MFLILDGKFPLSSSPASGPSSCFEEGVALQFCQPQQRSWAVCAVPISQ